MQVPLQIAFHETPLSDAVEAEIREKAAKLEEFFDRIISCRVVVESAHKHHHQGRLYGIKIHLVVPGEEIVVDRGHHDKHAHEDIYVAIRDAFDAVRRLLEDYARRMRGQVKTHASAWSHGHVARIFPEEGYGFIASPDGLEIYFHQNSVLHHGFGDLHVGAPVLYVSEEGEKGPQASSVRLADPQPTEELGE